MLHHAESDDDVFCADPALQLEAIPGLLATDDPLDWAWDHLRYLGQGEHAVVFEHPSEPNWVVRVSDYPDGWFNYAWDAMGIADESWRHAPLVADFAHCNGIFLAICERLDPIDEKDAEAQSWLAVAQSILLRRQVDPEELAAFCRAQPDFEELLPVLTQNCTDVRAASNWMMRGRYLVLNDPQVAMTSEEVARFKARWTRPALDRAPASTLGSC